MDEVLSDEKNLESPKLGEIRKFWSHSDQAMLAASLERTAFSNGGRFGDLLALVWNARKKGLLRIKNAPGEPPVSNEAIVFSYLVFAFQCALQDLNLDATNRLFSFDCGEGRDVLQRLLDSDFSGGMQLQQQFLRLASLEKELEANSRLAQGG